MSPATSAADGRGETTLGRLSRQNRKSLTDNIPRDELIASIIPYTRVRKSSPCPGIR